mgnify:CR=1 FL=1
MRSISESLLSAQRSESVRPAARIRLIRDGEEFILGTGMILSLEHTEETYSHSAKAVLDNSDGAFSANDYRGWQADISYGAVTGCGEEYSACAPLWILNQEILSSCGRLICLLSMAGIPDMLAEDRASCAYMPPDTDSKTVKDLVREIMGDSGVTMIACFDHCRYYDVVFDSEDSITGSYCPRDGFRIYMNGSRLSALKRLLDNTYCVMRFGGDGKVHILEPSTGGTGYDYQYQLAGGHTFFSGAYRSSLVIPNYVVVCSHPGDSPQYSGYASDGESIGAFREMRYQKYARVDSNEQAESIAAALLYRFRLGAKRGEASVPMNCGAELFDYVSISDGRCGEWRYGNIGSITRKYSPGSYKMKFSFGGWLSARALLSRMEVLSDIGLDFYRLGVKNLYAERIGAGEIDVDELSAISADIGDITAGTITGINIKTCGDRFEVYRSDCTTLRGYLEGIVGGLAIRSVDGGDVTLDSDEDVNLDPASGGSVRVNRDMRLNSGCSIESEGDLELDPGGNDVIPAETTCDLGNASLYWDNVEYCDLIDRSPSPYFINDALNKLRSLTTHTTVKKREGHPDRVVQTFRRESLPPEVIVPVTQHDREKADAIHNARIEKLEAMRVARKRCLARISATCCEEERACLEARLCDIDKTTIDMEAWTAHPPVPQPGISMNATIGMLISAAREIVARIESLESRTADQG